MKSDCLVRVWTVFAAGSILYLSFLDVGVSRFDASLEGLALGGQLLERLLLPRHSRLHGAEHAHLLLLELLNVGFGPELLLLVHPRLEDVLACRVCEVIRLVLAFLAHHLLASVVGVRRLLGLVLLLGQLLSEKVIVV